MEVYNYDTYNVGKINYHQSIINDYLDWCKYRWFYFSLTKEILQKDRSNLYVILNRSNGLLKVGMSINPERRIKEIQKVLNDKGIEHDLVILKKYPCHKKIILRLEGKVHSFLCNYSTDHKEWFDVRFEDICFDSIVPFFRDVAVNERRSYKMKRYDSLPHFVNKQEELDFKERIAIAKKAEFATIHSRLAKKYINYSIDSCKIRIGDIVKIGGVSEDLIVTYFAEKNGNIFFNLTTRSGVTVFKASGLLWHHTEMVFVRKSDPFVFLNGVL